MKKILKKGLDIYYNNFLSFTIPWDGSLMGPPKHAYTQNWNLEKKLNTKIQLKRNGMHIVAKGVDLGDAILFKCIKHVPCQNIYDYIHDWVCNCKWLKWLHD